MKSCIQEKVEKTPIGSCCLYKPSIDRVYVVLRPVREYDVNTARQGLQLNVLFVCLLNLVVICRHSREFSLLHCRRRWPALIALSSEGFTQ